MYGVVTRLAPPQRDLVATIWNELDSLFGLKAIREAPEPHFSFHVAPQYRLPATREVLRDLAARSQPFQVHSNGLGIFTGETPVLYLNLVRNPALTAYHAQLWQALLPVCPAPDPHYHPDAWLPHVSLAHKDTSSETIGEAVRFLASLDLNWDITIDHLALMGTVATGLTPEVFPFVAPANHNQPSAV